MADVTIWRESVVMHGAELRSPVAPGRVAFRSCGMSLSLMDLCMPQPLQTLWGGGSDWGQSCFGQP